MATEEPKTTTRIKTKIITCHDTEENWNKATTFIPKSGEVIVYSPDSTYAYSRITIGDGTTTIANLPFINEAITNSEIDEIYGTIIELAEDTTL